MKRLITATLAALVAVTINAAPQERKRQTIIVKDGKVVSHDDVLVDGLLPGGKRAFLGVSLIELTPELREHYGAQKDSGVLVGAIEKDGPAEKAGLRVGDLVLSVDGQSVDSSGDVRRALREKKSGDNVRLEVLRGKSRQTLVAGVEEREGIRMLMPGELEGLPRVLGAPEWRARVERLGGDCGDLQARIKDLESRLRDLEKKLQK